MAGESSQSPGGRRDFGQDTLRPVTIKQLVDAEIMGDETRIDNHLLTQITLVAQIRNVVTQTTNTTYKLDDGTGSIEAKQWMDAEAESENSLKHKLVEGEYCRVYGKLKNYNDKRHVAANIIRPLEDMNEVSYHLLDATAVHLHKLHGPPGGASSDAAGANGNQGRAQQSGAAGPLHIGGQDMTGYQPVARKVFQYMFDANQTDEGLHQQKIAADLGLDTAEVARAGDQLLEGGLIYTTIDDSTWAVLEPN
ncbi:replication protein A, subunit RPA32 [Corynespora cassiicola Philippines]|uniref:Replication protein A, subunit RPA32 n=1 Tax=Corynespora cassiicola Philippines TaxID=1448308 RepID=A0A2T2P588_CORCC|nr:replication protein A, subunit RPA32 [Corynespora cassiicola Philippines]